MGMKNKVPSLLYYAGNKSFVPNTLPHHEKVETLYSLAQHRVAPVQLGRNRVLRSSKLAEKPDLGHTPKAAALAAVEPMAIDHVDSKDMPVIVENDNASEEVNIASKFEPSDAPVLEPSPVASSTTAPKPKFHFPLGKKRSSSREDVHTMNSRAGRWSKLFWKHHAHKHPGAPSMAGAGAA